MQIIGFILFIIYGVAQIVAGYMGIDFHLGAIWAGVAIFAAFFLRFTLPITIGAFFGAMDVWQWRWSLAALFVASGLVFIIPGIIMSTIGGVKK